ncbi:carboxymuconolactone decarboxylase family protein [Pseudomonas sp.]|uniref:carboxymuconolactone decarboxylase family protein n=1 Tax=Pseudomonas sp. TaxID=306 RepID=UPI003D1123C3
MAFISNPELRKRGQEVYAELYGGSHADEMTSEYNEKSSDFADMSLEWAIGGLFGRPGLDLKSREFVAFALCVADGRVQDAVLAHAEACIRAGATKREVYEVVLNTIWYVGAGGASLAFSTLKDFFADMEEA